jgi:enoyl-CoA hydratase
MADQNLFFETDEGVITITLNRPKALNALNLEVVAELQKAIEEAEQNDDIRVIVITGAGRAFVAGADIMEFLDQDGDFMAAHSHQVHQCFLKIINCSKPVIAAINGVALGGGLELAMACHYRVASEKCVFGQPEVMLGAIPGGGATQTLPRLIGKSAATYYLLTGENITAVDAYRLGIVDKLVAPDMVMVTAMAIAKVIARKAPIAVRLMLEGVTKGFGLELSAALELEESLWRRNGNTEDFQNGVKAFTQKKPVVFKGK